MKLKLIQKENATFVLNQTLTCSSNLQGHYLCHEDARRYMCNYCTGTRNHFFKSKEKKETHERMHPAADKILKCEHCDDFLKLRCEKTRHEMTSHFAKSVENPQKCQYCQGIYTKEDLKRHNADQMHLLQAIFQLCLSKANTQKGSN